MPTLVSWNLNGIDDHRLDERMEAACFSMLLRDEPPEIVALQEVVDRALVAHLRPHLKAAGFAMAVPPSSGDYYVIAGARAPLKLLGAELHPFATTRYGRALLVCTIAEGPRTWWVGTAHLESGREEGAARHAQLAEVVAGLAGHDGPGVFVGDTNLRAEEAGDLPARHDVTDAWEALGSPDASARTWSRPGTAPARWFRFDRCYTNRHAAPRALWTDAGDDASDHLALWARVEAR